MWLNWCYLQRDSYEPDSSLDCATQDAWKAVAGSETRCQGVQPSEFLGPRYSPETWLVAVRELTTRRGEKRYCIDDHHYQMALVTKDLSVGAAASRRAEKTRLHRVSDSDVIAVWVGGVLCLTCHPPLPGLGFSSEGSELSSFSFHFIWRRIFSGWLMRLCWCCFFFTVELIYSPGDPRLGVETACIRTYVVGYEDDTAISCWCGL